MNWLGRLLRGKRMEAELDKELRFHFEEQVAEKRRGGMSEAKARRATRLEFGGLDQVKEDCRESRGTQWLASIAQDLRFGLRILARSPGFSVTAIVVLALGIGVSTLAFSLYNLIALQAIPVREPETLVHIERRSPENITPGVPHASILYYRDHAKSLSAVMETMGGGPMVLGGQTQGGAGQDEQRAKPEFVSANYFSELGARAEVGRLIAASSEGSAGAAPVAVLSYRLWQRKFGGDAGVVGQTISLGGKQATVIGVTPEGLANPGTGNPDVWLPLAQYGYFVEGSKALTDPEFNGNIVMYGRLAQGVTRRQAAQELLGLTNQLREIYPKVIWENERILVTPGAHFFSMEDAAPVLAGVGLLVTLILGIACANLGGLLMARGLGRQREIQLRFDLGARRMRVFRQLLTENLLLGLLGSAAALPLSYLVLRVVLVYANAPGWMSAMPDWRVVVFTLAMGSLAALFFGLLPTLQPVRRKRERGVWHQMVVCVQVGASCVLLILAGLLVRATLHLLYTDPGFGYEQVVAVDPGLTNHGFTAATAQGYLEQLQGRLRGLPGVRSVALASNPPLVMDGVMITGTRVDGRIVLVYPNWVGPGFFETMGIPVLRGRVMREGETHGVVISESLARRKWPNEDPIGKPWNDGKDMVVGIVGNTRAMELNNTDAMEVYYPPNADTMPRMTVLVRAAGDPARMLASLKAVSGAVDTKLFPTITPLTTGFQKSVARVEQIAAIVSLLGGVAIFLAVVGLLGLVTYAVAQRTKEIAIRLALGAGRMEIFGAILRRFAWPVGIGLICGVGVTAGLSQVLRRVLYGISGLDLVSYAGAIAVLMAILLGAALLPLRRAFRLDIARTLHSE